MRKDLEHINEVNLKSYGIKKPVILHMNRPRRRRGVRRRELEKITSGVSHPSSTREEEI